MKKICFIATTGSTINAFMLSHILYLQDIFDIFVVVGDGDFELDGISTVKINIERKINIRKDITSLYKLYTFFKKENFDIVLSISPKAGLLSMLASFFVGTKVRIHYFTGQVWVTKKGLFQYILKNMDKVIGKISTNILVDSQSQKDFLVSQGILDKEYAKVLCKGSVSGVNINKFAKNISIRNSLRLKYRILNDEIVFMYLGRINEDKGILDLSEVFLKLLTQYNHIKLMIIGPIEDDSLYKRLNTLFKNSHVITKLEYVNNPEEILNIADVLVLPSYREGFGTIVIEAASMGIPTIASNIYGLKDAIVDNKTGLLHECSNITDMYHKYTYFIENKNMIELFGMNAKNRVLKNFNTDIMVKELRKFLKEQLG